MDVYTLSYKKFEGAKNLPLIRIEFLNKKIKLDDYDALIFTSKNGVEAIDKINPKWKDKECYSIGEGTSKIMVEKGVKPAYTAKSSYGDDFAKEIKDKLKNKKTLFLKAKIVLSSLPQILKEARVDLYEEIVYKTKCNDCKNLKPPKNNSVIIFSSPSTVECFLRCFKWHESYKAVAIGKKTASFIPGHINYSISPKMTMIACIDFAKEL